MSESKHTPGPWKAFTHAGMHVPSEVQSVHGNPGMDESELMPVTTLGRGRNQSANARLIAAAPDLLEALEEVSEWLALVSIPGAPKARVRAAIAEAKS